MVIRRTSGKVVELSTVWVSSNTKPRRNRRKGTTTAQKQDENERDCVKRLARAINCNFSHGDLLLTPKYDQAGMERIKERARKIMEEKNSRPLGEQGGNPGGTGPHPEDAGVERSDAFSAENACICWEDALLEAGEREGRNYVRRLGRALQKEGVELRCILVTADTDGETGEPVRLHHHIIIPRVGFELAAKLWTLGTVDYQILRAQDDYTPLAVYLMKQVRRRPDAKKYTCSRNLKKPRIDERWAKPGEELRPDRGGLLMHRNEWEAGKPQYIRFIKDGVQRSRGKDHAEDPRTFPARGSAGNNAPEGIGSSPGERGSGLDGQ